MPFAAVDDTPVTVGAVASRLPAAKSLNDVNPVAVAVVAVLVDDVGEDQVDGPLNLRTTFWFAPLRLSVSRSTGVPLMNVNVAL